MSVIVENARLRYVIDPQARNASFVDLSSGRDCCQVEPTLPAARVRIGSALPPGISPPGFSGQPRVPPAGAAGSRTRRGGD